MNASLRAWLFIYLTISLFASAAKQLNPAFSAIGFSTAGAISGNPLSVYGTVVITRSYVMLSEFSKHLNFIILANSIKPNVAVVFECFAFQYPFLILIVFTAHKDYALIYSCVKHAIMCMCIST